MELEDFPWVYPNARVEIYWEGNDQWYAATIVRPSLSHPGYWYLHYDDKNPSTDLETPVKDKWRPLQNSNASQRSLRLRQHK